MGYLHNKREARRQIYTPTHTQAKACKLWTRRYKDVI